MALSRLKHFVRAKVDECEEDRIIRVTSFVRTDGLVQVFGNDFDSNIPDPIGLYRVRHSGFPNYLPRALPTTGLGSLEVLPTEIIGAILSLLTVRATMRFRGVNRQAKNLVHSMVEYRAVTTHAAACFQSVFCLKMSETLRFADIYRAMCMPRCEKCDGAGEYIYLPTLTRCCLRCLHVNSSLQVVESERFGEIDDIPHQTLCKNARTVHALPRSSGSVDYGNGKVGLTVRATYIDYTTAAEVVKNSSAGGVSSRAGSPRVAAGFNRQAQPKLSFVVSCPLPLFDRATWTSYYALSCKGCALAGKWHRDLSTKNTVHTRESFLEHAQTCVEAQKLWEISRHGQVDIRAMDNRLIRTHGRK